MSQHPDSGRGDTDDMAAQIYRANLAARAERVAEIREAMPGAGYWATLTTAGVATLAAWAALGPLSGRLRWSAAARGGRASRPSCSPQAAA